MLADFIVNQLRSGKVTDYGTVEGSDSANIIKHELRCFPDIASLLITNIFSARRFRITPGSLSMAAHLVDNNILPEQLHNVYLPYDSILIEVPLKFLYGSTNTLFLYQNIGDERFSINIFNFYSHRPKPYFRYSGCDAVFDKTNPASWKQSIFESRIRKYEKFRDIGLKDDKYKLYNDLSADDRSVLNYVKLDPPKYNLVDNTTDKLMSSILDDRFDVSIAVPNEVNIFQQLVFNTHYVTFGLALLNLFNLKSSIPIKWTHNIRETRGGKRGLSHSVIDIDINAKQYLPKPKEEDHTSGIKKRHHEVRGSWCLSHKTGKDECQGICVPMEIDERRIKCLQCGKKSWLRKNHERGDKSLGTITKEYKVIAS